jgi:osmotically-inducible protein OsmY
MLQTLGKTDLRLREDVEAALKNDGSLVAAGIGVAVTQGVVTLTGQVPSYWQKSNAERDVERIHGVHGMVNRIDVHVATDRTQTDTDIATAAVEALARNSQVPRDQVTVKVCDGWVTLTGTVEYEYQRRAATHSVRDLRGVTGVANGIYLKPRINVGNIKDQIEKAFERQAFIDAGHVSVTVHDHKVELGGMVRSWAERREAENAAAATAGVTSVENHIAVSAT